MYKCSESDAVDSSSSEALLQVRVERLRMPKNRSSKECEASKVQTLGVDFAEEGVENVAVHLGRHSSWATTVFTCFEHGLNAVFPNRQRPVRA